MSLKLCPHVAMLGSDGNCKKYSLVKASELTGDTLLMEVIIALQGP